MPSHTKIVAAKPMETSQPLAIESFSYRWLLNVNPAFDTLDEPLRSPLESDSNTVKLKNFSEEAQNFNFDTPIHQSPAALLHADELFSNGLIKPLYVEYPSKRKTFCSSNSIPAALPVSSFSSRIVAPAVRINCSFLGTWRKPSKKIMQKCFGLFRPLCQKIGGLSRKSTRVDDIDRRSWEVRSGWSNSPQASPRTSIAAYSTGFWYDCENPINEAVLHCKRSIEK